MFKYKLNTFYNVADYSEDYIGNYLKAIGISDANKFMSPSPVDELDPYLLQNMDKGIKLLKRAIDTLVEVYIVVDSDPDGYTSSSIFYNYINTLYPNITLTYSLHEGKEHGVELNKVPSTCGLVVIPDAGSSQKNELLTLAEMGKYVLVLDHHESDITIEHPNIAIINNQLSPQFSNKALSGAGVTFKFVQAFDEKYNGGHKWRDYYDLATLGIISDVMYSGNLDNNYIINTGLKNIKNHFLAALVNKQSYSISSTANPNKIDIAFYITPIINGVIRIGTQEEKENLFKAMRDNTITEHVYTEFRGKERDETFYEYVARESANIKSRQDALITKTTEAIFKKIEEQGLQNHQIIVYKTSLNDKNEVPKVLTGLVAMKICAKYNRCTLVLRPQLIDGVQYYMGSGRGKRADGFDSLREFCLESGLVEYAQGHALAHGVSLQEDNIEKLVAYADEQLKDMDFGSETIEVCGIQPPIAALNEFAANKHLYGNGIPEPTFAFTGAITKQDIQIMGARQDTVKIKMNNITFIKFHAKQLIEDIQNMQNTYFRLTIAGRPQQNEFRGRISLQVVIDNFMVEPYELI